MTRSDKARMLVDDEPVAETMMTSSSWSSRHVSWLHLCIIYGLLGIYGLWAVTSYQLMRSNLLDELEAFQRRIPVAEEPSDGGTDDRRLVETAASTAVRRRRSADEPAVESPAVMTDVEELPVLSRSTRETRDIKRRGTKRRRRYRKAQRRQSQQPVHDEAPPARRQRPANVNQNDRRRKYIHAAYTVLTFHVPVDSIQSVQV